MLVKIRSRKIWFFYFPVDQSLVSVIRQEIGQFWSKVTSCLLLFTFFTLSAICQTRGPWRRDRGELRMPLLCTYYLSKMFQSYFRNRFQTSLLSMNFLNYCYLANGTSTPKAEPLCCLAFCLKLLQGLAAAKMMYLTLFTV